MPLPANMTQASTPGAPTNWWVALSVAALTVGLARMLVRRSCRARPGRARWTTRLSNIALAAGRVLTAI
jgi:hypothetical protein